MNLKERIEQLERVVAHLAKHAPVPEYHWSNNSSEELLRTDVRAVQDRAYHTQQEKLNDATEI